MNVDTSVDATADLASAWSALTDVADWPRWTESMTKVERLDDGPLRVGSRARVEQPGMRPMIWEVTELRPEREFAWAARVPGVRIVGRHLLAANADGTTRITLELAVDGPLAGVINALTGKRSRRYLGLEANGLKAASEAAARG